MSEEATPVQKLVYVMLLSAIKQNAERMTLIAGKDAFVVNFTIGGVQREEMRPPVLLREAIFEHLREMTSGDLGTIHLMLGADRDHFFGVTITTTGPVWRAEIRPITAPSS